MAQRQKPVTGIDIDPVGITAAQVGANGRITLKDAVFAPLEPGIVRDGEIADPEALGEALKALFAEHKGLDRRVRVGVANQKVVVRTLELPPIDNKSELDAAVRFQAQDAIPMPLEHAVLDYQVLDVVETPEGPRQRVLIAAARRDMVDLVVAAVKHAGLRLEAIDLAAFAMIRALAPEAPETDAVLFAQVAGMTNVAVARGPQCLFARASGTGIEGVAVELAERRALTLEHARAWLQHVGLEQPAELIEGDPEIVAEARRMLQDGVHRIASEIRQSLDFHHMQSDGAQVASAVLTGPAVAIPGFAAAVGAEIGLPVAHGSVDGTIDGLRSEALTIAAGLGVGGAPAVNLLPPDERRAAGAGGRSGGAVYAVLGGLAAAVLLLAVSVMTSNQVSSKEEQLAAVTVQADEAERSAAELAAYSDFASLRQKRLETVRSLAASRFDWSHALAELSRTLPENVWLTTVSGSVTPGDGGGGSLRSALALPAVEIVGCTTSQSNVARMMSAMRRIDGVERVSLESSEKADEAAGGEAPVASDDGSGGSGGGSSDCRNGSDKFPQFKLTVFFAAPAAPAAPQGQAAAGAGPQPAAAPAGGAAAPAPAAQTGTDGGAQ
ncbi:MAG: type IV pilus assembly protein PilM [Solirubrobacteraceae bacterium]|jgi:type IV pilus assembly protein PilM|nr:type IV pilus assembly protein PilM [Solirubrobacteraceae bacterium]